MKNIFRRIKTVIKGIIAFWMMIASGNAIGSPLDQPADGLHEAISYNKVAAVPTSFTSGNDTTSINTLIDTSFYRINTTYKAALKRLKGQAAAIKEYAVENGYNSQYCFLVDMSVPCGKNRFFIYNMDRDSVEMSSLVAHGFGSTVENTYDDLEFSNDPNSFKTSLGRYKIGEAYNGTYGLSYKLYGLDKTNDRAFERAIVLHADVHVPEKEPFPYHIFRSAGCPTVSPSFLTVLGKYIKASKRPVLMWIYYSE